jgi:hypothetical protein
MKMQTLGAYLLTLFCGILIGSAIPKMEHSKSVQPRTDLPPLPDRPPVSASVSATIRWVEQITEMPKQVD